MLWGLSGEVTSPGDGGGGALELGVVRVSGRGSGQGTRGQEASGQRAEHGPRQRGGRAWPTVRSGEEFPGPQSSACPLSAWVSVLRLRVLEKPTS